MKCRHTALTTVLGLLIGFSWGISSWSAQQSASATVPVSTVVSVEARRGKDVPALNREDVRVFEGRNRLQVTDWIALQGDQSVSQAQRTGTQVSAIYASGFGHFGHSLWRINQGQNNLSRLADETGGEAYFQGFETPIAFAPFLDQFAVRLNHQYKLTFLASADKKPTRRHVRLETEVPNAELVIADKVYVPAAK